MTPASMQLRWDTEYDPNPELANTVRPLRRIIGNVDVTLAHMMMRRGFLLTVCIRGSKGHVIEKIEIAEDKILECGILHPPV